MKRSRQAVEIDIAELRRVVDRARQEPISEAEHLKLKVALDVLDERLRPARTTEKTRTVIEQPKLSEGASAAHDQPAAKKGHGRNAAGEYTGARKVVIPAKLTSGETCPECARGKVYTQRQPKTLVRVVGQTPVEATVYELERLRCNACGQVFTAEEPEGIGSDKYDATAVAMIAQLKYGTGVPFTRLERLQGQLGIPLPATTQWELLEERVESLQPAFDQLIWQAAQGDVLYNDDTGMRILRLAREPSDKHGDLHQRHCVGVAESQDRAVLHRAAACRREPCRLVEAACGADEFADSNVRCSVAEHAEVDQRSEDPAGQLHGTWKTSVCGRRRELSAGVRVRAGNARYGVRQRCFGA